jgi:hypothetical protein
MVFALIDLHDHGAQICWASFSFYLFLFIFLYFCWGYGPGCTVRARGELLSPFIFYFSFLFLFLFFSFFSLIYLFFFHFSLLLSGVYTIYGPTSLLFIILLRYSEGEVPSFFVSNPNLGHFLYVTQNTFLVLLLFVLGYGDYKECDRKLMRQIDKSQVFNLQLITLEIRL